MGEILEACPFCGSGNTDPKEWMAGDGSQGPGCENCGATARSVDEWNAASRRMARLAEAERDAARYAYFKRANVLTIDWIIGLPVEEWDTEVDRWIGKEQWRAADSAAAQETDDAR